MNSWFEPPSEYLISLSSLAIQKDNANQLVLAGPGVQTPVRDVKAALSGTLVYIQNRAVQYRQCWIGR